MSRLTVTIISDTDQYLAISLSHSSRDASYNHKRHKTIASLVTACATPTFSFSRPHKTTSSGFVPHTDTTGHFR